MLTIHRTTIVGQCPHGGDDIYKAEFITGKYEFVAVERIQEEIDKLTQAPIYQETLTQLLANRLDCKVKTYGTHGKFETECEADPEEL